MILDLHVHSRHSRDSLSSIPKVLKAAKKKGLDGIAVTDHDTIRGGVEARDKNRDEDFTVIVGAEIRTDVGDIVGLFLTEELRSKKVLSLIEEIQGQGGIAILPHPYRGHRLTEEVLAAVDAIEVCNSRESWGNNAAAQELARSIGKPAVGGSDAHFCIEIGSCRTVLESGDAREEILANRTRVESRPGVLAMELLSVAIGSIRSRRYTGVLTDSAWCAAEKVRGDTRLRQH